MSVDDPPVGVRLEYHARDGCLLQVSYSLFAVPSTSVQLHNITYHGGHRMNATNKMKIVGIALFGAAVLFGGCATPGGDRGTKVTLSGAEQNPPVTTSASGSGTIT